jgi:hypothetical protein
MSDHQAALVPCELHELEGCGICHPPEPRHRRGHGLDVAAGSFVSIRGGRGVYHHPDCFNVTGDWDGGDTATLGERVVHTSEELAVSDLRPADCCQPPLFHRR